MRRHELTDEEWKLIEPYLPSNEHHEGHPFGDHRTFLNGMIWRLATGVPWRDLPERFGKWNSIYQRFRRWCKSGFIEQIAFVLQAELESRGYIDWGLWCVDGSNRLGRPFPPFLTLGLGKRGRMNPHSSSLNLMCELNHDKFDRPTNIFWNLNYSATVTGTGTATENFSF